VHVEQLVPQSAHSKLSKNLPSMQVWQLATLEAYEQVEQLAVIIVQFTQAD
jgi:hypothetical protein